MGSEGDHEYEGASHSPAVVEPSFLGSQDNQEPALPALYPAGWLRGREHNLWLESALVWGAGQSSWSRVRRTSLRRGGCAEVQREEARGAGVKIQLVK